MATSPKDLGYDPLRQIFSFRTVRNKVVFGIGSRERIGTEITSLKGKKPLIVTDSGVAQSGLLNDLRGIVESSGFKTSTFDKLTGEPTLDTVQTAANFARGTDCDLIIGLGGGSAMDTAKVVAAMKTNERDVGYYLKKNPFTKARLPLILIPTTAGTGAEVTADAVMFAEGKKRWISDAQTLADTALVDPVLTISMPPKVTASTGLDVLAHAIEGMMVTYSNPLTDTLALKAIQLALGNLERAYFNGKDLAARYRMMLASTLAGMVNENCPATFAHSVGYTLTGRYGLPHGISCGIALPYVMSYNIALCEEKFAEMVQGLEGARGLTRKGMAAYAVSAVKSLVAALNVPSNLQQVGVPKSQLEELAKELLAEWPRPYNLRQSSYEDVLQLYKDMWEDRLTCLQGR
jgi:alcohol dehydrogenase